MVINLNVVPFNLTPFDHPQTWIDDGREAWEAAVEQTRGGSWLAVIVGASPFNAQLIAFLAEFAQRPVSCRLNNNSIFTNCLLTVFGGFWWVRWAFG